MPQGLMPSHAVPYGIPSPPRGRRGPGLLPLCLQPLPMPPTVLCALWQPFSPDGSVILPLLKVGFSALSDAPLRAWPVSLYLAPVYLGAVISPESTVLAPCPCCCGRWSVCLRLLTVSRMIGAHCLCRLIHCLVPISVQICFGVVPWSLYEELPVRCSPCFLWRWFPTCSVVGLVRQS